MNAGGQFTWTPNWAQLGAITVTLRVSDPGGLSDTRSCTITVGNQPPVLSPLPNLTAHPGVPVSFTAQASDLDGDPVTFSLVGSPPAGATMTASGQFSWTPSWSQVGAQTITVAATDPGGLSDTRSSTITVGNQAPILNPLPSLTGHPGAAISFLATASDPDGDPLTFSLVNAPPGATMTANGQFSWTPGWFQLGAQTITVRVTDPGGLSDTKSCTISVDNQAPTLDPIPDQAAQVGVLLTVATNASDPDGDPLTYTLTSGPPGATLSPAGVFSWIPGAGQVGASTVTITVTDPGGLSSVRSFTVTVN
jgi:hypothetical protein